MEQTWTRADFDRKFEAGTCPGPPPSRKWNYLCCTKTGKIHNLVALVLWPLLFLVLFPIVLTINLATWAVTYSCCGGAIGVAKRTTQPRQNFLMRWILSLIAVFNVVEIPKPWDKAKAEEAFEKFRVRNGFSRGQAQIVTHSIDDSVRKPEVVHKYHRADCYPASLHHVWVLCGPNRTFVCSTSNFAEYDGTSCFNLVRGFVQTYYEGKAPLVRAVKGNPELDLTLNAEDANLRQKLGACLALKVAFKTSFLFAVRYGRMLLTREIFDMLGCASPTVCTVIETIDLETNSRMTAALKKRGQKVFPWIMRCSALALQKSEPRVERPILLTQVSCQSRYYTPKVPRTVCGNWLIGLGARPTLHELSDDGWATKYYRRLIQHITSFSGEAAWNFINQAVYGFLGTAFWANPRAIYWFNNYGLRDMHPDAGAVTYHWGPNYTVATYCLVNVVTVDGRTCITLLSSVVPQGELQKTARRMKQLMVEGAATEPAKDCGSGEKHKKIK